MANQNDKEILKRIYTLESSMTAARFRRNTLDAENLAAFDGIIFDVMKEIRDISKNLSPDVKNSREENDCYSADVLARELRRLNPNALIAAESYEHTSEPSILLCTPIEELKFPDRYYYNEKNGITNKHKSLTGAYSCASFEYLPVGPARERAKTQGRNGEQVKNQTRTIR